MRIGGPRIVRIAWHISFLTQDSAIRYSYGFSLSCAADLSQLKGPQWLTMSLSQHDKVDANPTVLDRSDSQVPAQMYSVQVFVFGREYGPGRILFSSRFWRS